MPKRLISLLLLTLLLVGIMSFVLNIKAETESGTVYIRPDGSIDPPTAPVSSVDNVTYKLINNILANSTNGVVIERNNTILDGAGFELCGKTQDNRELQDDSNGVCLTSVTNVTVRNISIRSFHNGIYGNGVLNSNIEETNLYYNDYGIYFQYSCFNAICGNNITENTFAGIWLELSQNNEICKNGLTNSITSNGIGGIKLQDGSNYNNISENYLRSNSLWSIYVENSWHNQIFHNNFYGDYAYSDSSGNVWDHGYPHGGNFWSTFNGTDLYNGPYQNLTGSDGVVDTPCIINGTNVDYYPLMKPYLFGDVNSDGNVDMQDIGIVAAAFGTVTGDPRWNFRTDVNFDGQIDLMDLGSIARNFGDHI